MKTMLKLGRPWGIGLMGLVLGAGLQAATAAPVARLNVLSFNIWVQGGLSLSNCIEVIRSSGADVVGLQECNATTVQTIATRLGFYALPASDASIVSRYPIVASLAAGNSRGVTVELSPGQRAHLFNCHLAAYPYGPYELKNGMSASNVINLETETRLPALNQLLVAMQPYLAGSDPCFLVGDFNAPSHFDYANLPWPTSVACTNAGLGDAYTELHSGNRQYPPGFAFNEPGITWTPMTSQEPEGVFDRIDFVHYSRGDGITPTTAVELDGRNSISLWPSDHRAVLGAFTLTPPALGAAPSAPLPPHGATNVPLAMFLSWLPASNMIAQAVYFGTNSPGLLATNTTHSIFNPDTLQPGSTYYWRVDSSNTTGVVTGEVWSFTTTAAMPTRVYEWTFALGDLSPALGHGVLAYADAATSNLTRFGTTDGTIVPHIGGQPAPYLAVPQMPSTPDGYLVTLTGSQPNDGGGYINQYTVIQDLLIPAPLNWTALFNTNPQNANDADFYVNASGALGIGLFGYSAGGVVAANTWCRVAFAADLRVGRVSYYVNGVRVHQRTGGSLLDERHSLYSGFDPGPDLLLFNEGDTSGNYTHALHLGAWALTDRTLTDAEIGALGGPKAGGIFPGETLSASVSCDGPNVVLRWGGGKGPFRVERSASLAPLAWQTVGASSYERSYTEPLSSGQAFYRVAGQ